MVPAPCLPGSCINNTTRNSRIAFEAIGLVGLDIKSHQAGTPVPFPNLVQGNVVQDQGCDAARLSTSPADVRMPSGGPFAWFSDQGYMVTSPIREHVRHKLRSSWSPATVGSRGSAAHPAPRPLHAVPFFRTLGAMDAPFRPPAARPFRHGLPMPPCHRRQLDRAPPRPCGCGRSCRHVVDASGLALTAHLSTVPIWAWHASPCHHVM